MRFPQWRRARTSLSGCCATPTATRARSRPGSSTRVRNIAVVEARSLGIAELAALFREGFSDYEVPLALSDSEFAAHLEQNDIDLACSRVVIADRPASLALIGRRGEEAWVGGMATAPAYRRRGFGEQALVAGIEAVGCPTVWLEVLDGNHAAIALYDKLGFERVRELTVWALNGPGTVNWRPAKPDRAHAWIAAQRTVREPWQRADQSLRQIEALVIERDREVAGAVLYFERAGTRIIMQAAAVDDDAARDSLLATKGPLRFANVPAEDRFARVLEALGADREASQFELRLRGA